MKKSTFQHTDSVKTRLPGFALGIALLFFLFSSLVSLKSQHSPEPYPLNYPANFGSRFTIPVDNPTTKAGVYLGRKLFYEKKLSSGNAMSCATCHQQKLAFTDGKALSTGVDGALTTRNSMSLANLLWVRNFFWDGRSPSLEDQAVFPLTNVHEMGQAMAVSVEKIQKNPEYLPLFKQAFGTEKVDEGHIRKALAQFERTLISANSKYDQYLAGTYQPSAEELRGMNLFMDAPAPERGIRGANCGHCHGGPKTFKELFHNNGLDTEPSDQGRALITGQVMDKGRFRVPTLRNIALTAPYMHDGRLTSLEEVLDHYNGHLKESPQLSGFLKGVSNEIGGTNLALKSDEKAAIISFLHMLTDTSFINNPEFSDPDNL